MTDQTFGPLRSTALTVHGREVGTHILTETLTDIRDFLISRDMGNWGTLTEEERDGVIMKAEKVAVVLLEQALDNLGRPALETCVKDNTLATAIVDLLPMPQFRFDIKVILG